MLRRVASRPVASRRKTASHRIASHRIASLAYHTCHVMSCHVMSFYLTSSNVFLCHIMSFHVVDTSCCVNNFNFELLLDMFGSRIARRISFCIPCQKPCCFAFGVEVQPFCPRVNLQDVHGSFLPHAFHVSTTPEHGVTLKSCEDEHLAVPLKERLLHRSLNSCATSRMEGSTGQGGAHPASISFCFSHNRTSHSESLKFIGIWECCSLQFLLTKHAILVANAKPHSKWNARS